jgi:tetratricopeptide (TPR) repeat protein
MTPGLSAAGSRADKLIGQADALLGSGKQFERAAGLLRTAIRIEPRNSRAHSLLGCAYASRALSLEYAMSFRKFQKEIIAGYPDALKSWQEAQKDPKDTDYRSPKPRQPRYRAIFPKDDGQPIKLSNAAVSWKMRMLSKKAESEWKLSVRLARSPMQRAETEETYGWGLALLCRATRLDNIPLVNSDVTGRQMARSLKSASDLNPRSAAYAASVGDALIEANGSGKLNIAIVMNSVPDKALDAKYGAIYKRVVLNQLGWDTATDDLSTTALAYRRALAIAPNNRALAWKIYSMARQSDPESANKLLLKVAASCPDVAIPHYLVAINLLMKTPYQDIYNDVSGTKRETLIANAARKVTDADRAAVATALGEVRTGNAAHSLVPTEYSPTVPTALRAADGYGKALRDISDGPNGVGGFGQFASLRALARDLGGYARVLSLTHDYAGAEAVTHEAFLVGEKLTGTWPVRESPFGSGDVLRTLVGTAVSMIGLTCAKVIAEESGDAEAIRRTAEALSEYKSRVIEYKTKAKANMVDIFSMLDMY